MKNKKTTIIIVQFIIILLFLLGVKTSGTLRTLYYSYYADIFIPFGFYFLLILSESKYTFLKSSRNKALMIFTLCSVSEILQYFGVFALARVFDPFDFVMYGIGVLLAIIVDKIFVSKIK